jgi:hypothetical protein
MPPSVFELDGQRRRGISSIGHDRAVCKECIKPCDDSIGTGEADMPRHKSPRPHLLFCIDDDSPAASLLFSPCVGTLTRSTATGRLVY